MTEPRIDRPVFPKEYGVAETLDGLLSWDHVDTRMRDAMVYWIATSSPDGRPRVRPLDGLWLDRVLYVGGSPVTLWARDLAANPRVAVHLDGGTDVVILDGTAELLQRVESDLAERLVEVSNAKYPQYGMTVADYAGPGPFAIHVRKVMAWTAFPRDVTRFRFGA